MKPDMEEVKQFYAKQNEWAGVYSGDVTEAHRKNAAIVHRLAGGRTGRLLDLGAGGGQNAAAAADLGYSVVAVELVPSVIRHARDLASQPRKGQLDVIEGDFYELELSGPFDIVCYWDGFGIGSDEDQHRLLGRIATWIRPTGFALVEVYTPWFWAGAAGRQMQFGEVTRRYDFDTQNHRLVDRWWRLGDETHIIAQSLRCYSIDDLRTILEGTGLSLESAEPRGAFDFDRNRFYEHVAVGDAMQYLARLVPTDG